MTFFLFGKKISGMKTLKDQIQDFLRLSGTRQSHLSYEAGLPPAYICRLLKDVRKDMLSENVNKIRAAMMRINPAAAKLAMDNGSHIQPSEEQ